jgi:hypothetical protein
MSNYDYTRLELLIEDAVKDLRKDFKQNLYDFITFNKLRSIKIGELQLSKTSKYNLNVFDENYYSYKLIF